MSAAVRLQFSPAEYLALERAAEAKHELVRGEIYAMAGASPAHNRISFNLGALLGAALAGSSCQGYSSDQRVAVAGGELYTYPDLTVVCGEPEYDPADPDTLLNPTLIVEVLSPSTEAWDRGGKFAHYRGIASLREYVMVSQDRPLVERYFRRGNDWVLAEFRSREAILALDSVGARMPLSEIYARVNLPERPER